MAVGFNYADVQGISLKDKRKVKAFVASIFEKEGYLLESLNYVFCSDSYLLQINKDFLQHDYFTDIITFGLSPKGQPVIGEIYISIERVKENSAVHRTSISEELLRVIFHGALHLCGHKDKTKREITVMREKEDYYLRLFGLKIDRPCST